MLGLLAVFGGACRCDDGRLQPVEECRVQANHEKPELCNDKDDNCSCAADTNGDGIVCGPGDEGVDEGCDDDRDGFCDANARIEGRPAICPRSFDLRRADGTAVPVALDCDDGNAEVNPGAPEKCDGLDNNCNARADLDDATFDDARVNVPCNDGTLPPEKAGTGICTLGKSTCEKGRILCFGTVGPGNEVCDGKDNDCNGQTDEGAANYLLCSGPTNPLKGECHPGFYLCRNGQFDRSVCVNEVVPTAETCNGKDDDCNGAVDDGARSNKPVYVVFHLDCSGSMQDKINQIKAFLNDLNTLPSIYLSSQIKFAMVMYPDSSFDQLAWVHQTFTDVNTFRTSLSGVSTANCGGLEPNVDSVAYGLCASRPTSEWPQTHTCRTLYDAEWNRCGGSNGNPASYAAGTICKSVLTGGYLTSRLYDLPVPDGAHQLHVLLTDEELQTHQSLTAASANGIKTDLRATYAANGWMAKIRVACFLDNSYASQFAPMCDATYPISSSSTSSGIMTDFTKELQDIYCQ
ncbi:MAG TPA: putative metal-binding motif-containing protein [Candidatus Eisenbacteria bacterium]|nr:putative metal-binding motif-containing protein [Candidatus Eisenbacteria bacterium]